MMEVGCYLCGSDQAVTLFKQDFADPYLSLVDSKLNAITRFWKSCQACGFVYRTPMLTETEQDTLYKNYGDDIFKKETPDVYFDRIDGYPDETSENAQKTFWLKSELEKFGSWKNTQKSAEVLDVGCGAGLLLHKFKKILPYSLSLNAVELNPDYAELAGRRASINVLQKDYRDGLFGKKFDLVACTKVLEHVRDPIAFVKMLGEDLKDDGVLFMEVPDVSDLERLPAAHDRFYIPHIYFFSHNAMAEILARNGLGILACRSVVTPQGRGYLQVLASRSIPAQKLNFPLDPAEEYVERRRKNFEN